MRSTFKVKLFLLLVCLVCGLFSQVAMAAKVAQVKLINGLTYEFTYSSFNIGWGDTVVTQDSICIETDFEYSNLDQVIWYGYTVNTCNQEDDWEFDVSFIDNSFPPIGYLPITTAQVSGTLYGTSTTMTIPYGDIDYVQFYDKACPGSWEYDTHSYYFYDICYEGDQYVTVGTNGNIMYWRRYSGWDNATSGTTNVLRAVISDGQKFMTVGYNGVVKTSTNAETWTTVTSFTSVNLQGVAYGNSTYVTVGDEGVIFSSTNGTSWTDRTPYGSGTLDRLYDVTYGNSMFVAVGANGAIWTSSNGTSWTKRTSGTTNYLYSVTWGNGKFVTVGQSGKILTSTNGTSWTSRTSGTTLSLYGVTYSTDVNEFMAVGHSTVLLTSFDGINWNLSSLGMVNPIWGVAAGNFGFTASGASLFIYKSCK